MARKRKFRPPVIAEAQFIYALGDLLRSTEGYDDEKLRRQSDNAWVRRQTGVWAVLFYCFMRSHAGAPAGSLYRKITEPMGFRVEDTGRINHDLEGVFHEGE